MKMLVLDAKTGVLQTHHAEVIDSNTVRLSPSQSLPISPSPMTLRLWLPGYHTPSLNVTTGAHWKVYFRLKKQAAAALLAALDAATLADLPALDTARRALALIALGSKPAALPAPNPPRLPVSPSPSLPVSLIYTRVTVRPLDFENLAGSTKALTDCLRYAFPALLPDDAPEYVTLEHRQQRVSRKCEQGTWVEITRA